MASDSNDDLIISRLAGNERLDITKEALDRLLYELRTSSGHSAIKTLRLGGSAWSTDAAQSFSTDLERMNNIRVVDLSDTIVGRDEDEAALVLETLTKPFASNPSIPVEEVNLSFNPLGLKGNVILCSF